ncbi:hypothetical protein Taro_033143 [Colocasia esculenta]|uniref:Uncharacterized protein n=1 Tax=Colocasia esculenta TaxID=4460 RepID=A0A843VT38_COLES|nr:hypothetical protein [Colocasia esculenta]
MESGCGDAKVQVPPTKESISLIAGIPRGILVIGERMPSEGNSVKGCRFPGKHPFFSEPREASVSPSSTTVAPTAPSTEGRAVGAPAESPGTPSLCSCSPRSSAGPVPGSSKSCRSRPHVLLTSTGRMVEAVFSFLPRTLPTGIQEEPWGLLLSAISLEGLREASTSALEKKHTGSPLSIKDGAWTGISTLGNVRDA